MTSVFLPSSSRATPEAVLGLNLSSGGSGRTKCTGWARRGLRPVGRVLGLPVLLTFITREAPVSEVRQGTAQEEL